MPSHDVVKVNKRLFVRRVDTGELVYTPPDFLRHRIHNRQVIQVLADRMTRDWPATIRGIIDFESDLRP